jgi:hypothetical protein
LEDIGHPKILFRRLDPTGKRESGHSKERDGDIDESLGSKIDGITVEESSYGKDDYEDPNLREVALTAPCSTFTFDLSQDLLVTLDLPNQNQ